MALLVLADPDQEHPARRVSETHGRLTDLFGQVFLVIAPSLNFEGFALDRFWSLCAKLNEDIPKGLELDEGSTSSLHFIII